MTSERASEYLIRKGGAYYRPNAQGYTLNKEEAGRFTLDEAIRHSHPNGPNGPRDDITYEPAPCRLTTQSGEGRSAGEDALREALNVGEKFLNACFSAWSCGEPYHRVKTMMDRADEFRASLDSIAALRATGIGGIN